jgi:hypothetical protein
MAMRHCEGEAGPQPSAPLYAAYVDAPTVAQPDPTPPTAAGPPSGPGRHRLRLRRSGYLPVAALVTASAGLGLLLGLPPPVSDLGVRADALATAERAGPPVARWPARLAAAVIAVEDHRFYQHPGLDLVALGRVAAGAMSGRDEGGATIDVQLAKLLYTGGRQDPQAQLTQVGLALKLDHAYPKRHLLLTYLNCVYFGHGFYGATAAAEGYFGRTPDQLDWPQAALLAGLLQSPSAYDPFVHPQRATIRRNYVLQRLHAVGTLTLAQVGTYRATGLALVGR